MPRATLQRSRGKTSVVTATLACLKVRMLATRLSIAKPAYTKTPNLVPSVGVKLLKDVADLAKLLWMFLVDGLLSLNCFAYNIVNTFQSLKIKN